MGSLTFFAHWWAFGGVGILAEILEGSWEVLKKCGFFSCAQILRQRCRWPRFIVQMCHSHVPLCRCLDAEGRRCPVDTDEIPPRSQTARSEEKMGRRYCNEKHVLVTWLWIDTLEKNKKETEKMFMTRTLKQLDSTVQYIESTIAQRKLLRQVWPFAPRNCQLQGNFPNRGLCVSVPQMGGTQCALAKQMTLRRDSEHPVFLRLGCMQSDACLCSVNSLGSASAYFWNPLEQRPGMNL